MSQPLILKRSAIEGKIPLVSDLELGELAINTFDGKAYVKKDDGITSIVEIGSSPLPGSIEQLTGLGDATIRDTIDFVVSSDGSTITLSVNNGDSPGSPLKVFTEGLLLDVPEQSITIPNGTDAAPKGVWVYYEDDLSGNLQLATSPTFPFEIFISIVLLGRVVVQSAVKVQTDSKALTFRSHVHDIHAHLAHLDNAHRLTTGVIYADGLDITVTPSGALLNIALTSGFSLGLHTHEVSAFDTGAGGTLSITNDFSTPYRVVTELGSASINIDSQGVSLTNRYYNLVIFAGIETSVTNASMFVTTPGGSYNKVSDAISDSGNQSVIALPEVLGKSGFAVARLTLRNSSGNITVENIQDLRTLRVAIESATGNARALVISDDLDSGTPTELIFPDDSITDNLDGSFTYDDQVAFDAHVGLADPHTQYLTPQDLPTITPVYFTEIVSTINPAYAIATFAQPTTPEASVQVSPGGAGVLLRAFILEPVLTAEINWVEANRTYRLDVECDSTNVELYVESYSREASGGAETLLATSETAILAADRREYNLDQFVAGPILIPAGDTIVNKFYVNKVGGGPDPVVTLYMQGTNVTRVLTQGPVSGAPAIHASEHEAGGADLIDHDNLTNATGTRSHSTIDTDLTALELGVPQHVEEILSGDGSQTVFTLSNSFISSLYTFISVGGVPQATTNHTVSGTSLIFITAPPLGIDNIIIRG